MEKIQEHVFGHIEIAPEAIELIIGIAVSKMKEVESIQGSLRVTTHDWIPTSLAYKGIYLSQSKTGEYIVDVNVSLFYGASIKKTAIAIQNRVKEQVLFMCDIDISEVNVHVSHLVAEAGVYGE